MTEDKIRKELWDKAFKKTDKIKEVRNYAPRCPLCGLPCVCSHIHYGTQKNPNPTCMCIHHHLWKPNNNNKLISWEQFKKSLEAKG